MTDFSRNQISSVRLRNNPVDPWVLPNDRQLMLRAKLGTGWSVHTNKRSSLDSSLSEDERDRIMRVINRAENLELLEQERIGFLVRRYESIQSQAVGDGKTMCLLCGDQFKFRTNPQICSYCHRAICNQCHIPLDNKTAHQRVMCKVCSEKHQLWKCSGAWFLRRLPTFSINQSQSQAEHGGPHSVYAGPHSVHAGPHSLPSRTSASSIIPSIVQPLDALAEGTVVRSALSRRSSSSSSDSIGSFHSGRLSPPAQDPDSLSVYSLHVRKSPLLNPERRSVTPPPIQPPIQSGSAKPDNLVDFTDSAELPHDGMKISPKVTRHAASSDADALRGTYALGGEKCPLGCLVFTLFYREAEQKLEIELIEAKYIPAMDANSKADPYVKFKVVPSMGKSRKMKSSTRYATLEPQWREHFCYYGISMDDLLVKTLVLTVMDEDRITSDDVVGECRIPLRQLNCYELRHYNVALEKRIPMSSDEALTGDERGKILLSLRYDSTQSLLHVGIVRCAALWRAGASSMDPFVKIYLHPDYSKHSKRKTATVKRTLNPEFQEEFIYRVDLDGLSRKNLEVTVWDHHMTRNLFIGGVSISNASSAESERKQMIAIVAHPNRKHDTWHVLRDIKTT